MLIIRTSVCSFVALANVSHHQLTMESLSEASRRTYIQSQIESAFYRYFRCKLTPPPLSSCRLSRLYACFYSCLAERESSGTCWNRFTFRPALRTGALWVTVMLTLGGGTGRKKKKKAVFLVDHPPGKRKKTVIISPDSAWWKMPLMSENVEEVH